MKWAESKDGFIAKIDSDGKTRPTQISTQLTRMHSHKLRAEHQAILVGRNTLETDNPSLTTRYWKGKNPIRIVLTHASPDKHLNIFNDEAPTLVMSGPITDVMHDLHHRGIQSVLVEGGSNVLQQFIDQNLWDEAYIEIGEAVIGEGVKAPQFDNKKYPHLGIWGIKEQKKHIKNIKSPSDTSL